MEQKVTAEQIKTAGLLIKRLNTEKSELEKAAQDSALEKRAQKIAFKEIELGLCDPFKTFEEFQEKVASLMTDDLDIVEKALERGYGSTKKAGDLADSSAVAGKNPLETFVLTGELHI
jgi:cysteinyl-tRNA synthetase